MLTLAEYWYKYVLHIKYTVYVSQFHGHQFTSPPPHTWGWGVGVGVKYILPIIAQCSVQTLPGNKATGNKKKLSHSAIEQYFCQMIRIYNNFQLQSLAEKR